MSKSIRIQITQPPDLVYAMKRRWKQRGYNSLSEYLGELAKADLPAKVRKKLSERPRAGKPKGKGNER